MKRLTYKDSKGNYQLDNDYVSEKGIDENGLDEITDYIGELEDLEEKLGFELTELEEVSESSIYVTACKEIHFNGDDFYGDYTPEELKQVIKNILGEYLRCMREVKQ